MREFSDLAKLILKQRYFMEGETWYELCQRVTSWVSQVENSYKKRKEWKKKFFEAIYNREFLPNSPVLWGAGRPKYTLSACFVIPIEDDMDSIMEAVHRAVNIFKSGGGVGFNISSLRPEGFPVSRGGTSSGGVTFLELFDKAGDVIKQGGKRRSAIMSVMNVRHPDIFKFINAKSKPNYLTNMNMSVLVNNAFMEAVVCDDVWELRFNSYVEKIKARDIMQVIAQRAWESGEPGILFYDRINEDNYCMNVAKIKCTNPCGEEPLRPNESCTLGSIDLSKLVTDNGEFNYERFKELIEIGIRFLDDTIDCNYFPDALIDNATKKTRPIGLGIMGVADLFIKMGLVYGDVDSIKLFEDILKVMRGTAISVSHELAKEKGVFPAWRKSYWNMVAHKEMRNSQLLSIAPTGSISIIAGCSSGIEPIFSFKPIKRFIAGYGDIVIRNKWENHENKSVLVDAKQIGIAQQLNIVEIAQKYIDAGVSKTFNLAHTTTPEEIEKLYIEAWQRGLKGMTVFRDGSFRESLLNETCPECGEVLKIEGRCKTCPACGWSGCSL